MQATTPPALVGTFRQYQNTPINSKFYYSHFNTLTLKGKWAARFVHLGKSIKSVQGPRGGCFISRKERDYDTSSHECHDPNGHANAVRGSRRQ